MEDTKKRRPGAPTGHPRYGGRTAGTPNKKSEAFLKGLLDAGCVPPVEIAQLLQSPNTDEKDKLRYWEMLLPYCYPQLKAIDPEGYLTVEQAAGMLGAQMARVRAAIERCVTDTAQMAIIFTELYPHGTNGA